MSQKMTEQNSIQNRGSASLLATGIRPKGISFMIQYAGRLSLAVTWSLMRETVEVWVMGVLGVGGGHQYVEVELPRDDSTRTTSELPPVEPPFEEIDHVDTSTEFIQKIHLHLNRLFDDQQEKGVCLTTTHVRQTWLGAMHRSRTLLRKCWLLQRKITGSRQWRKRCDHCKNTKCGIWWNYQKEGSLSEANGSSRSRPMKMEISNVAKLD